MLEREGTHLHFLGAGGCTPSLPGHFAGSIRERAGRVGDRGRETDNLVVDAFPSLTRARRRAGLRRRTFSTNDHRNYLTNTGLRHLPTGKILGHQGVFGATCQP